MNLTFGISANYCKKTATFFEESSITRWFGHRGVLPLRIPSKFSRGAFHSVSPDPFAYAKELDALIVQGDTDLHPKNFGQGSRLSAYEVSEEQDLYELRLIEAFVKEGKPILGICRGFWLLNAFFKGSLLQPLNSAQGPHLKEEVFFDETMQAFRHDGDSCIFAIQWQPEFSHEKQVSHLDASSLFETFYKAAKDKRYFGSSKPNKMKKIKFGDSVGLSLGGEIELQILDANTFDLKPICSLIIDEIKDQTERTKGEIFQSMIEIESGVCTNAQEVERDWAVELQRATLVARTHGAYLGGSGTHPFGLISERILSPDPRYQKLIDRNQWIARRIAIFGLHVHVGMPSREDAIRFYRFYMAVSPLLLGLSSSSPFWEGENTGLSSVRSTFFESTPAGGHPPCLASWQEFEGLFSKLLSSKAIGSHKDLWWDLRPSIDYGTIELRICDVLPTIRENAAIVALVHLLGLAVNEAHNSSFRWPDLSEWSYRENKWRAARHGLDFNFILKDNAETISAKQYLLSILDLLDDSAEAFGYQSYMSTLRGIVNHGTSSQRQLEVFKKTADLTSVVKSYVKELETENPNV